jgi:hypothetical protein
MLATVSDMKQQQQELQRRVTETDQRMAQQAAKELQQKTDYAVEAAPKATKLVEMFTPPPTKETAMVSQAPLAGMAPNPLVQAVVATDDNNGVGLPYPTMILVCTVPAVKKLKHGFLGTLDEDSHETMMDAEDVIGAFCKFIVRELSAKAPEAVLTTMLRKAKHIFLAKIDTERMDVETVLGLFCGHIWKRAAETPLPSSQ